MLTCLGSGMVIGGVELCCTSDPDICDSSGILPVM